MKNITLKRFKAIKFLLNKGYKIESVVHFAGFYYKDFIKTYDCLILSRDKNYYFAKISYNNKINLILHKEYVKSRFLYNYMVKAKIGIPRYVTIYKSRDFMLFLNHYYKPITHLNLDKKIELYLYLIKFLYKIYKNNKKRIIKIFPLRSWDEIYHIGSAETYTGVEEVISYYEKERIIGSCFVNSYKKSWCQSRISFDNSLSLVNNNLKLDDHILNDHRRIIISDWKRACVSSIALDYGLLKRRLLNMETFKNHIDVIDKDILRMDSSLLNLSNLVMLHRVFSEIYTRILSSRKTYAFHKNPFKIGSDYILCINNLKKLSYNYFLVCHQRCYELALDNLRKEILKRINFPK
jgi:hypothetical protein